MPNGHGNEPRRTKRVQGAPQQVPAGFAPPPLGVMQQQFTELLAKNQASLADLQRQGVALDPFSMMHARIDKLIDSIAQFAGPDGPRWAVLTRLAFERYIEEEIETAATVGRRAQIAQGAAFTPSMIADLARQTGVFRPHK